MNTNARRTEDLHKPHSAPVIEDVFFTVILWL